MKDLLAFFMGAALIFGMAMPVAFAHVSEAQEAGTSTAVGLPGAGLTPHSPFYFLDRLGETLRDFFTFNKEAKARLQIAFAKERIAEIKVVLETRGVEAPGISIAELHLKNNLSRAAEILEEEKQDDGDVEGLAKELDEDFAHSKEILEETLRDQKQKIKDQEEGLKQKIRAAKVAGNAAEEIELKKQLDELRAERKKLELREDKQEDSLREDEEKLEKYLGDKEEAAKAIRGAEERKHEVLAEAEQKGVEVSDSEFKKFDQLLSQAKELFMRENYKGAKQLARQAKASLEGTKDTINKLEKEMEDKEDDEEAEEDEIELKQPKLLEEGEEPVEEMGVEKETKSPEDKEVKEEEENIDDLLRGLED